MTGIPAHTPTNVRPRRAPDGRPRWPIAERQTRREGGTRLGEVDRTRRRRRGGRAEGEGGWGGGSKQASLQQEEEGGKEKEKGRGSARHHRAPPGQITGGHSVAGVVEMRCEDFCGAEQRA